MKTATRQKHVPLNGYVSLHYPVLDSEGDGSLLDCIPDERVVDPADSLIDRRDKKILRDKVEEALSDLESQVLRCYLQGKSYREMSKEIHCRTKCIDNALQRVKRKIGVLLPED